jgi:hypothetical protein
VLRAGGESCVTDFLGRPQHPGSDGGQVFVLVHSRASSACHSASDSVEIAPFWIAQFRKPGGRILDLKYVGPFYTLDLLPFRVAKIRAAQVEFLQGINPSAAASFSLCGADDLPSLLMLLPNPVLLSEK